MPQFILDTSGEVTAQIGASHLDSLPERIAFHHLDSFVQGYIEALFFTENEPSLSRYSDGFRAAYPQEYSDTPDDETAQDEYYSRVAEGQIKAIPGDYGFSDLAPETLAKIIADCAAFQRRACNALAATMNNRADYNDTRAGHDFWFTRNGHGVGFWDRDLGDAGEELSAMARDEGESDAYIGDDGKVYVS